MGGPLRQVLYRIHYLARKGFVTQYFTWNCNWNFPTPLLLAKSVVSIFLVSVVASLCLLMIDLQATLWTASSAVLSDSFMCLYYDLPYLFKLYFTEMSIFDFRNLTCCLRYNHSFIPYFPVGHSSQRCEDTCSSKFFFSHSMWY